MRYNFIQNETKKFEAIQISHEIALLNTKTIETQAQADKVNLKVGKLREMRQGRRVKRHEIEGEWRKLSGEIVEEGGSQVLKVQIRIGELKSKLTELTTKISSGQSSLEGLKRVKENNQEQYESIHKEIRENRLAIRQFKAENDRLRAEMTAKQTEHDNLATETGTLWGDLGENSKKARELQVQIDGYFKRLAYLRSEYAKTKNEMQLNIGRLKELNSRKERFTETLTEIESSLNELDKVQKEQKAQLKNLEHTIERKQLQKETVEREVAEAGKIAGSAKEAVIEFATQRELAETVAAEEKALRGIEEMGEAGAITGVYGRLRNLIKIDKTYKRAIEAAAGGWLEAMVVKDIDTAFLCSETLKKMKLGRIKIIPLQAASNPSALKVPDREGVAGAASAFIKCEHAHEPAVNYVFGDTLIVADDKIALNLSSKGYRAVTVNGDLYETGGGFESGFYRAPIDFSTIIPSEKAIKSLDEAVLALQQHLAQRGTDITGFQDEIERTKLEMTRLVGCGWHAGQRDGTCQAQRQAHAGQRAARGEIRPAHREGSGSREGAHSCFPFGARCNSEGFAETPDSAG